MKEGFPKWGFALVAMLALMFGANGVMVWLSSHGRHDLVRSDYYDAGLDQDGVIARNGLARQPGMRMDFHRDASVWRIEIASDRLRDASCKIRLYRPDDGREDKTLELKASVSAPGKPAGNIWITPAPALRRGFWVALVLWERDGKPVMEESFRIFVDG